jgi:hypothetical protein
MKEATICNMLTRGDKYFLAMLIVGWLIGASAFIGAIYVVLHFIIKYW